MRQSLQKNLNWDYKSFEVPKIIKEKWLKVGLKGKKREHHGKKSYQNLFFK